MTDEKNLSTFEEGSEDFAAMFAAQEAGTVRLQPGQKVTGTIITITGDSVFVDVGIKLDGIMDRKDILDAEGNESVAPGDSIEVYVVGTSAGEIRLSRSMSGAGMAALEDARDAGVPVDGRVTGTCKGGYTVSVMGKNAFCPGSQMDSVSVADAEALVGRTMQFPTINLPIDPQMVLPRFGVYLSRVSRRALLDRERQENLEKVLASLNVGDTVEGRITRLASFGAFMELAPGVEGMIHLSELSWSRVNSADEAVAVGDMVRAKLLSVSKDDKGRTRISLSRKKAEGDPWLQAADRLAAGTVVEGKVVRIAPFGAFVELLPGVEGLVHLSEMSWTKRVNKAEDVVNVGDVISVKIKEINVESRRISLSLRDAEGDPWQDADQRFAAGTVVTGTVESRSQFGLFVSLAPGITGLLPAGVIKNAKNSGEFSKLDKGDSVTLVVQSVDTTARRISLAPEGMEEASAAEDKSWKQHTSSAPKDAGMSIMAQALQKALQNKR